MAATVQRAGLCTVKVNTGAAGALETLGFTRNGADVTADGSWVDVPGDENGGDDGPPIDVQYLGEIARIRLEFTKWDEAIAAKIRGRLLAAVQGVPSLSGTFMFNESKAFRLVLDCANAFSRNFPRCFPRAAVEMNHGTKFAVLVVEFEAHKDATGVLFNEVVA